MNNEQFWKKYVGDLSAAEFCARRRGQPIVEFVMNYVDRLPHFYGIVLRTTWRETFATQPQWRRDDVSAGLIGHLEAHREEWENAVYAPEPEPLPPEPVRTIETEPGASTEGATYEDPALGEPVLAEAESRDQQPPAEMPTAEASVDSAALPPSDAP